MDLYKATIQLPTGVCYSACITDNYYIWLRDMNLPYKLHSGSEVIEVPLSEFRKEAS